MEFENIFDFLEVPEVVRMSLKNDKTSQKYNIWILN